MEIEVKGNLLNTKQNIIFNADTAESLKHYPFYIIDALKLKGLILPEIIGFAGEEFPLFANLSVCENIFLPMQYHYNISRYDAEKQFSLMAKLLDIEKIMYKRKNELSTAELIKSGILRAIILKPEVVFIQNIYGIRLSNPMQRIKDIFDKLNISPYLWITASARSQVPDGFRQVHFDA